MNKILLTVLMCLLITITACKEAPHHIIEFDKDTFEREWAAWKAQAPHSYQMEEEIFWATPWTVRFTVENDEISVVEFKSQSHISETDDIWTVSKIYNEVAKFYNNRLQLLKNAPENAELLIDITYAPEHYPTEVHCSYDEWGWADEDEPEGVTHGFSVWIKSFTALAPQQD